MRTFVLLILLSLSIPARADFFDDPYGTLGSSQRTFDEMIASGSIRPPPIDADENDLRHYFNELEERDDARWRLQRDAEMRVRKLEERQEEIEEELEERELMEGFKGWRD